jgi:hypothetical protein
VEATGPTLVKQGVQEFRSSGVQEFRSSGVQEFRSSGVQEFRSSGVQEFRSSGVQGGINRRVQDKSAFFSIQIGTNPALRISGS